MEELPIELNIWSGLIAIGVLLVLNAILSMAETALVSVRKARLQYQSQQGNARATAALKLTEEPNRFLSVIQIGITSTDLLTGALTGATLGVWIEEQLQRLPQLAAYSTPIGIVLEILPITYL